MRFGVLGPLAVWASDGRPVRVPEVKVRALLAILLVHEGRRVSADRLADDLWGVSPPGNAANTLQTKVSQLRRALDRAEPGARELVAFAAPGYRLRIADGAVDVQRFRELTARARAAEDPRTRAAMLAEGLALWRGPALADFADEAFAAAAIRRLDEERLVATEEAAAARLELGEHGLLVGELGELVAAHPTRETLRALQMRALYRAGRQREALESYTAMRAVLASELGLEPGPELAALHQAILRQDPALDARPALSGPRTNLPTPIAGLVGRDEAVRAVRDLVGRSRLVTLTGPGGVGKTRLAIEVARGLAEGIEGGARLVELAGLDRQGGAACSEEHVLDLVAGALGIREEPAPGTPGELVDRVVDALRTSTTLLVLDNCEQLVDAVAAVAGRLLREAPGLRVLATSQEPLGLAGEVLWAVPPLDGPSAVELFVARSGTVLDDDTRRVVAAICRRLDGIPLALELAATRVRALGVHELLSRLDDRFRLLDSGHRDAPSRQRTLRAMIDWSWGLLTRREQVVLRRLAVHAEGCGLDAAEAVCAGDDVPAADVLGLLARLVDRSLVECTHGPPEAPRYRLLESVAVYCVERAREAGELDELHLRHAAFHVELAERADPLLRGPQQHRWLERLDAESPNIRRALDTAARVGDADLALRLVVAQTWYWFLRGRLREARRSAEAALAVPGGAAAARAEVAAWQAGLAVLSGAPADEVGAAAPAGPRTHWFLGYVLTTLGDMATGERHTAEALADGGAPWVTAAALSDRASQAMARGDIPGARRDATRSAELFAGIGDRWGRLQASFMLGALAELAGDYAEATRQHRDGLRDAEELGLWPEVSYKLSWLGRVAMLTGDHAEAAELHERAMLVAAEQGFAPGEMYAETGLALGARRQGRLDEAEKHLLRVLDWHRGSFAPGAGLILAELGFVAEQRGDATTARTFHDEALALAQQSGDPRAVALALEGLAGVHALTGDPTEARRLLAEATALRESVGVPLPQAERHDIDRIAAAAQAQT